VRQGRREYDRNDAQRAFEDKKQGSRPGTRKGFRGECRSQRNVDSRQLAFNLSTLKNGATGRKRPGESESRRATRSLGRILWFTEVSARIGRDSSEFIVMKTQRNFNSIYMIGLCFNSKQNHNFVLAKPFTPQDSGISSHFWVTAVDRPAKSFFSRSSRVLYVVFATLSSICGKRSDSSERAQIPGTAHAGALALQFDGRDRTVSTSAVNALTMFSFCLAFLVERAPLHPNFTTSWEELL
jgi:hypothetical protein